MVLLDKFHVLKGHVHMWKVLCTCILMSINPKCMLVISCVEFIPLLLLQTNISDNAYVDSEVQYISKYSIGHLIQN